MRPCDPGGCGCRTHGRNSHSALLGSLHKCPLLICAYPVLEVLFSTSRRHLRRRSLGQPDRLHLHSLIKRRLVRRLLPGHSQLVRNSVTGLLLWFFSLPVALLGYALHDQTALLMLCLLIFVLTYQVLYVRLVRFKWCLSGQTRAVRIPKPLVPAVKP